MVFGIGDGQIDLDFDKPAYQPGDTITGKARLKLGSPRKARCLRLEFFCEKTTYRTYFYQGNSGSADAVYERTIERRKDLAPERTYKNGEEFKFELLVPANAVPPDWLDNIMGKFRPIRRWYIEVTLDLPAAFDISRKAQINLTR